MKRLLQWMMAAILICGTTVFTACSSGDDDVKEPPVQPEQPDDDGANSGTEGEVTYISRSWDGEKVVDKKVTAKAQWLNEIQVGAGQEKALSGTWYVTGAHKIQGFLKVETGKTLDIILCDGSELSLPSIRVEGGTFRLFGQSQELGVLFVGNVPGYSELNQGAAIGAHQVSGGTVEIHSGNIMAFGGDSGAGIGGFMYATIGRVKIYGGGHYIEGGRGAAGIGAPPFAMKQEGKIEIFGGILTAVGGMPNSGRNIGGGAGIGGGAVLPVESVIIYGGDITAEARDYAAGIGTGQFYGLDHSRIHPSDEQLDVLKTSVIIKGGKVEAKGGCKGAGIGGGRYMAPGKIEISGGEVHAFGADGAGIGGGGDANPVEINISGGYVEAHGNNVLHPNNSYYDSASAGIGGGCNGRGGKITISGGEVHAYGGDNGAGIGGGNKGNSGDITISGGLVEAVGGTYGAGIGAGSWGMMETITINNDNGPVYVSGRAGNDCGLYAGSIGTYLEIFRDGGTLNIGNGVKVIGITDFDNGVTWADIPVASNPARWIYERCHVQLKTCDHPGYTAETCIYCKH